MPLFNKIHICKYENTNSPGTGEVKFNNGIPEIIIGINNNYLKFTEQILSHELLHFKLANDRGFIIGFDKKDNSISSIILSAFEHPLIIERQKSININIFDFLKFDIDKNILILKRKVKHKSTTITDLILWADRFCWGVFPSKIKIAKSLIQTSLPTHKEIVDNVVSEIDMYKSSKDQQNLTKHLDNIFKFLSLNVNYEIKLLKE